MRKAIVSRASSYLLVFFVVSGHSYAQTPFEPTATVRTADNDSAGASNGDSPPRVFQDVAHVPVISEGRGREAKAGTIQGRYAEEGCARSGYPSLVGRYAQSSVDAKHSVGYVGGGTHALRGEQRYVNEGTFGYDYSGAWFPRRIWLRWSHGDRYQAGAGAYQTHGPRIIPE